MLTNDASDTMKRERERRRSCYWKHVVSHFEWLNMSGQKKKSITIHEKNVEKNKLINYCIVRHTFEYTEAHELAHLSARTIYFNLYKQYWVYGFVEWPLNFVVHLCHSCTCLSELLPIRIQLHCIALHCGQNWSKMRRNVVSNMVKQ